MKFITIIGARPQFVKASSLSREIKKDKNIEEIIIHTGQHYDNIMSDIFWKELEIPQPKYNLCINNLPHGAMVGRMLEKIEEILKIEKPDIVIVYGDTNSTLAGSLAASKLHIPIAHIEAGLRSFNNLMPEEINRKLTDHISDYCFCPTNYSVDNLRREGISENKLFQVGDIMYDVFLNFKDLSKKNNLSELNPYCLVTLHREENTNDFNKLYDLFICLKKLSDVFNYSFIFPIHPRLEIFLKKNNFDFFKFKNILFTKPFSYLDMIGLEMNSKIILTDSGGVQKEAFWSMVPCLTLREETEWNELVDIGVNKIVGLDTKKIFIEFKYFLENYFMPFNQKIYGDGNTSKKILDILKL